MDARKDELEALVDTLGLERVLELLGEVCCDKADHLRTNWQDEAQARAWERSAKVLDKASASDKLVRF